MARESERKFLVRSDSWRGASAEAHEIRQFYLVAAPGRSLRVRLKDGRAMLTLKLGPEARVREEYEYPVTLAEARRMESFAIGAVIEKTRHLVRHNGHSFEVDVFSGTLAGLVIAELETEEAVREGDLPSWLGPEVTGMPAYYNVSLAVHGLPERAA